jgi:hypothetical protein
LAIPCSQRESGKIKHEAIRVCHWHSLREKRSAEGNLDGQPVWVESDVRVLNRCVLGLRSLRVNIDARRTKKARYRNESCGTSHNHRFL